MAVVYSEMKGRVAVITGAGGGIGRKVCAKLAESGAKIFAVDAFKESVDKVVEELKTVGADATGYVVDVRDQKAVEDMAQACVDTYGSLDYLVCCAGIYTHSLVEEMSFETWQQTIDINLTGTFLCLQKAADKMLANGFGRIVLLGSQSGVRGGATHVHYGATKGGIMAMTRAFMREVADKNIRINTMSPGVIETPMTNGNLLSPERIDKTLSVVPMGRVGHPEEIANVIAFLLSDESSYITGQTINSTGGAVVNT